MLLKLPSFSMGESPAPVGSYDAQLTRTRTERQNLWVGAANSRNAHQIRSDRETLAQRGSQWPTFR
jgi:hypothetical protein